MDLEKLRMIILEMHRSGKISEIPPHLFEDTDRHLRKLKDDYYAITNPLETRSGSLIIEEIGSIREAIQDVFQLRTRRILGLAMQQMEGSHVDREEIRRLLPPERELYREIVDTIERCRRELLLAERQGAGAPREEAAEEGDLPELSETSDEPVPMPLALARILSDMDSFMGVNGRIYDLQRGDIVTIPRKNAEVLYERNIALNIRLNK